MDLITNLKTGYPDLIYTKKYGNDTFDVILLKPFLSKLYPYQDKFISEDTLADFKNKLKDNYGNDKSCFKNIGTLTSISIDQLKFYQPKVGINGPRHTDLNEPVSVIKYKDLFILENGYHRILKKIEQGENFVQAYILLIN